MSDEKHLSDMAQASGGGRVSGNVCQECGFEAKTESGLMLHMNAKHPERLRNVEEVPEVEVKEKDNRIVYISLRPMLRTIRSTQMVVVKTDFGQPVQRQAAPSIKISFERMTSGKGMYVLDDETAFKDSHGTLDFHGMKALIEHDSDFRDKLIWVGAAGELAKTGPKIKTGPRSG